MLEATEEGTVRLKSAKDIEEACLRHNSNLAKAARDSPFLQEPLLSLLGPRYNSTEAKQHQKGLLHIQHEDKYTQMVLNHLKVDKLDVPIPQFCSTLPR